MNDTNKAVIRHYAQTLMLLLIITLLVALTAWFTGPSSEAGIRKPVDTLLAATGSNYPQTGKSIRPDRAGLAFGWTFQAVRGGKETGYIFVIKLTGNGGPYTGVFLYRKAVGVEFIGIASPMLGPDEATALGITPRILNTWTRRLNERARDMEN